MTEIKDMLKDEINKLKKLLEMQKNEKNLVKSKKVWYYY